MQKTADNDSKERRTFNGLANCPEGKKKTEASLYFLSVDCWYRCETRHDSNIDSRVCPPSHDVDQLADHVPQMALYLEAYSPIARILIFGCSYIIYIYIHIKFNLWKSHDIP